MVETLTVNVRLPDGSVEKRELTLTPRQDVKSNAAGQLVVSGATDEIVLLNATLANIAANTVEVTGPALGETTDGKLVRLPAGSVAPVDNGAWIEVGAEVEWTEITGKPATFDPSAHTHTEADITDLDKYTTAAVDSFLAAKSDTGHTHTESDITDLDKYTQAQVDALIAGAGDIFALDVNTTAAEFTSAPANTIWVARSGGLQDLLLNGVPLVNTQMVINLSGSTLFINSDGVPADSGSIRVWGSALVSYNGSTVSIAETLIPISSVNGLLSQLNSRSPLNHTHIESDISDLDKYTQAEVDSALAGKADTAHTHVVADITDAGTFGKTLLQAETLAEAQTKFPSSEITFFALTDESTTSKRVVGSLAGADTPALCAYAQIGSVVTVIGSFAFYNNSLESVTIPDSVTSIEISAFRSNNLTSVIIPDSVTFIGSFAFAFNSLTSVIIPDSVTEIDESTFNSNNLESVLIPDSVTEIRTSAFNSNNLQSVTIPDSVTEIGSFAFYNNLLTSVIIPDSVNTIGTSAFSDNNLESVIIPDSVNTIGTSAFSDNNLASVTIPNSVTEIKSATFINNSLESVTIPDSVTSIGISAFRSNNLQSVIIPDSVTEIGTSAFRDNNLTSVIIGNSVTSLGGSAFSDNNLASVTIPDSVTEIGSYVFFNNSTLNDVTANVTKTVFDTGSNILRRTAEPLTLRVPTGDTTWDALEASPTPLSYQGNDNVIIERI